MSLKNLLVHVDTTEAGEARLDAALNLAGAFDAHLVALAMVAQPFVSASVGMTVPAEVLDQQRRDAEERAKARLDALSEKASRAGRGLETRIETAIPDTWSARFARQARHFDLAVVGQPEPDSDAFEVELITEAAFMHSGRPALVIPYIGARALPPNRVLVGWDGSREAARAVNDALSLLARADHVALLVVDPEKLADRVGEQPGADIATHLARHGVEVEVRTARADGIDAGDVILGQASDDAADLVVIGGYAHSRLRELVLGGVTRSMLDHMTVPVLMAH